VPSLFVFSGDAYLNEMGITNPIFPNENCPQGNCALLAANPLPIRNDDGITQNRATGRLMRTQPLWGLRTQTRLLHDGRATSIVQAILAHDGQGKASRSRFEKLVALDRYALLAFLNSL
jgi:hypothetical protein